MALDPSEKAKYLGQLLTTVSRDLDSIAHPKGFESAEQLAGGARQILTLIDEGVKHISKQNRGPLVELVIDDIDSPASRVAKAFAAWQTLQTRFANTPEDLGLEEMDRAWRAALQALEEWQLAQ